MPNIAYTSAKYVAVELIGDILYWPIWWYSKGLIKTALFCLEKIKLKRQRLGLAIWIKNIFRTDNGQYDFESRLISFFIRLIQIIIRLILLIIWLVIIFGLFLFWLALPVIISYQVADNFMFLFY